MKRLLLAALGLVLAGTAAPLRADDTEGVTPHDVSQGTKDAAKKAKDTGNEGAYKLRHEKDKAVQDAKKQHKDKGGAGKSSGGVESSSETIKAGGQSDNPTVGNSY